MLSPTSMPPAGVPFIPTEFDPTKLAAGEKSSLNAMDFKICYLNLRFSGSQSRLCLNLVKIYAAFL